MATITGAVASLSLEELPAYLDRTIGAIPKKLSMERIGKQVGMALTAGGMECFDKSMAPDGKPWSPLKYGRIRGGTKPLLDWGVLRSSLSFGSPGHVFRVGPDFVEWGTNLIQAATHNFGMVIRPKKGKYLVIPASIDALRAGSPTRFPNADERLQWRFGKRGGIIFEDTRRSKERIKGYKRKKHKADKSVNIGGSNVIIHYYLTKEVIIPRRQFVEISADTHRTLIYIVQDEVLRGFGAK